jgi:hypothetical protein
MARSYLRHRPSGSSYGVHGAKLRSLETFQRTRDNDPWNGKALMPWLGSGCMSR